MTKLNDLIPDRGRLMPVAARAAWEVRAGIIPGTVDPQHSRRWDFSSPEWEGADGLRLFLERGAQAATYAQYLALLSSQGREVNWVETTFIWY
jgi:hypothetical protein